MQNVKMKALVSYKVSLPMIWSIGAIFPCKLSQWNKYPKNRTTEPSDNYLYLRETSLDKRWEVEHLFCFSGCWFSGFGFRRPEFFHCLKYWETCNFTLRWVWVQEHLLRAKSKAENLGLFALYPCYFLYLLFGCPVVNVWLLLMKQSHSPNVNHCIWAIYFWLTGD